MSRDVKLPPLPDSDDWPDFDSVMEAYARAAILADRAESDKVLRVALEALNKATALFASCADNLGDMPISEAWAEKTSNRCVELMDENDAAIAAIRAHRGEA